MTERADSGFKDEGRQISLPTRVIVSLRAGVILAIANVVCVMIFSYAWTKVHSAPKEISVTGSAKLAIQSDLIVWNAQISATDPDLMAAYEKLRTSTDKTLAYLKSNGVTDQNMVVASISTARKYTRDEKGNQTDRVSTFELSQNIQVTSGDVKRIETVARAITGLIKEGVMIESSAPTYIYTKLADLKVTMLAEATKDATARAGQIAINSGAKLGSITEARMGVMQITPIHTYETSGQGVSDTSSFEKEITAVVSAKFALER